MWIKRTKEEEQERTAAGRRYYEDILIEAGAVIKREQTETPCSCGRCVMIGGVRYQMAQKADKVYCKDCKYWGYYGRHVCHHAKNKGDWLEPTNEKRCPSEINRDNDCGWYEPDER